MSTQEIGKPGFRYRADFDRPATHLIEPYRDVMKKTGCLTGNVGDCIGRTAAMDSRIKSLSYGMKIVGPALTVRVPPTDNLMIHKALTLIKPGDVLVIEGGGNHSWALLGFLMVSTAQKARGCRDRGRWLCPRCGRNSEIGFSGILRRLVAQWPLQGRPRRNQFPHQLRRAGRSAGGHHHRRR